MTRADGRLLVGDADRLRPTSIAAILTILGYSLNDTVVIYDRIREMLRRYKSMPMPECSTFGQPDAGAHDHHPRDRQLALLALFFFGGQAIHSLHRRDDLGHVRRHLSSIFIGGPILIYLGVGTRRATRDRAPPRRKTKGRGRHGGRGVDAPHLPHPAPIEAYGNGGFRFAGMSHRGSLLCLPSGIWAWAARSRRIDEAALAPVFAEADGSRCSSSAPVAMVPLSRNAAGALARCRSSSTPCPPGRRRDIQHGSRRRAARWRGADGGGLIAIGYAICTCR